MVTDRVQRRIDALLDEADEAISNSDWNLVRDKCDAVLRLHPGNEDAVAFLEAANRDTGVQTEATQVEATSPAHAAVVPSAPSHPSSFVAGRYRVERFLGEGGRKRVFLAHDTTLDRDIAFAQIRTEGLDDLARERVMREAQSMARLGSHPNLVAIHDIGEDNGNPHLVEEYMAGGTVGSLLNDGPPEVGRTLAVATDVCRALSFMHAQGLIHRDLKPSNIFLTEDGTAKVGDFGLAVALDRSRITQQGSLVGTAAYMPPEQALGGEVTPQSDLYALGAMLYELVTGRPPFAGDDPTAVISQHINTPPVAPSWHTEHCPPSLEAVILAMLQKDPSERPESADAVLNALDTVDPSEQSARHSDSDANPLEGLARGVFVGRESQLERLRSAFDEAFAGRGSVVMLVGEPGIGKTRTTQELETYARMRSARVLWGRAHESSGAPAYNPWRQVGIDHARFVPPEEIGADLQQAQVNELGRIWDGLPGAEEPETGDAASAQFRLFDAYTAFIRAASERAPLVIVLDDLHWADKPSLLLLQHLSRELSRMRVIVIGTYRDTDLSRTHPLSEALAELNREGGFQRVLLRGLAKEEVGAFVRAVAGTEPSPSLVEGIYEETEGNPFFLSEVVNLMVLEGTLHAGSMSDISIPDGVKEALGRRLNTLSEGANELLRMAAVVGRDFRFDVLVAVADVNETELLVLLEESVGGRVIEESERPGRYRFAHALMQETLLAELTTTARVRLNGRIGTALESVWGELAEARASRLAHHFSESSTLSGHAQKAAHYAYLSAQSAEAAFAWSEAAEQYQACILVMDEAGDTLGQDRIEVLVSLARCYIQLEQTFDWVDRRREAMDLARSEGDGLRMAEILEATANPMDSVGDPLFEEALAMLPAGHEPLRGRLLASLAGAGGIWPQSDARAIEAAEEARSIAAKHGMSDLLLLLDNREELPSRELTIASYKRLSSSRRHTSPSRRPAPRPRPYLPSERPPFGAWFPAISMVPADYSPKLQRLPPRLGPHSPLGRPLDSAMSPGFAGIPRMRSNGTTRSKPPTRTA